MSFGKSKPLELKTAVRLTTVATASIAIAIVLAVAVIVGQAMRDVVGARMPDAALKVGSIDMKRLDDLHLALEEKASAPAFKTEGMRNPFR